MNNQTMQQTENKAFVTGILKEKKIDFKVSSSGRQMAMGKLIVVCDTQLGKGEVEVKVMQFADKKDGSPNSLYKALQTIAQTYKAAVEVGYENADLIKIEGSLDDETYYSLNKGDFVERLQIRAAFINRLETEAPHACKVVFEGCITKITPVEKELEVEIVGIGYQGVAVPVKGFIPEHLVEAFRSKYSVGCTAVLNIAILNVVTTKEIQQEVSFGEGLGEVITTTTSKRIIFGGGAIKYQGVAGALTDETVKQALALREARLENKKEDAMKREANSMNGGFGGADAGFGATASSEGFGGAMPQGGFGGSMPTGGFGGFPQ